MLKVIKTDKAPAAIGPYSQGILAEGKMLFTAGQLAIDPKTGTLIEGDIEAQTRLALENVKAILEAGGGSLKNAVKVTVFLKDMNDFARMNKVYETYFKENPPARSAVQVARLPKDGLVEIECVAIL